MKTGHGGNEGKEITPEKTVLRKMLLILMGKMWDE
jgi:hypothetical protein